MNNFTHATLTPEAVETLKSNLEILYGDLEKAVNEYVRAGYSKGDCRYINAYLAATLNAIASYLERLIETEEIQLRVCSNVKRKEEPEAVKAIKCANNLLKHNSLVIKLVHGRGGITFPIEFNGQFSIPEIAVDWAGCDAEGITVRNADQMIAFEHLFVGRPLLGTLRPIVQELLSTDMGHFNEMAFLH